MAYSSKPKALQKALLKVTRLAGKQRLSHATRVLQRMLTGLERMPTFGSSTPAPARRAARASSQHPPAVTGPANSSSATGPAAHALSGASLAYAAPAARPADADLVQGAVQPVSPIDKPGLPANRVRPAAFTKASIEFEGHTYPYRLYVPARQARAAAAELASPEGSATARLDADAMPLLVLLHGCKQDALDFANGTAMNQLADLHQCMVLYPEQTTRGNSGRCWNWFEPAHQKRDTGEPGMIAALTKKVLRYPHNGERADPERVYIAGLSAGGAMAAVTAHLYPDLFAAVGVHSGLPAGAAQGMLSAFGAMQRGAKGQAATALPTIVFHGTGDRTVHPDNGEHVSDAALTALRASGLALVKTQSRAARAKGSSPRNQPTRTEKTVYSAADGPTYLEHWRVEQGPHAWSGGHADGSYTDPDGPSASAAMMSFFLQHKRPSDTSRTTGQS